MPKLHKLTDGEMAIIRKAEITNNPNYITGFFLKNEASGTWWRPGAESERWFKGYETLYTVWSQQGHPDTFEYGHPGNERKYRTVYPPEGGDPMFHDHHGFLFQPWQLNMYNRRQRIGVVVGGFGCGKSVGAGVMQLVKAVIVPGFRSVVLAPNSTMTTEIFTQLIRLIHGTPYADRFLIKSRERPFPEITIGNDYVGTNLIQFFPIGDAVGVKKILTLTLHEAMIDQAEQLDNIKEIVRAVGSRFRGVGGDGRAIRGKMTFLANADVNEELWNLYDEHEKDPDRVWVANPSTWDNPFITDEQIGEIKKDVGGDEESIRVHMEGGRPIVGGEHFSQATLAKCRSEHLDMLMRQERDSRRRNYSFKQADRIGVWEWVLPKEQGHKYLVVADPGYSNPPERNAAVVMVFDYTYFPHQPATLRAFWWVFGNNSPWPWIEVYTSAVKRYDAYFSNAIDDTGTQSLYNRVVTALKEINVGSMPLNANNKLGYLNLAKTMMSQGMIQFPSISRLFHQLSRYRLPDDKIPQDIVMTILIACGWLEAVFYISKRSDPDPQPEPYNEIEERYGRYQSQRGTGGSRYSRERMSR